MGVGGMLLVASGMLIRFWAWAEITIRIWLFNFVMLASGDVLGPTLHFTNLQYTFPMTVTLQAPELEEDGSTPDSSVQCVWKHFVFV